MTESAATPVRRSGERLRIQNAAAPATQSASSHGSAMATSGTLTTVSTNGHMGRCLAPERRSSTTWLAAPIQAESASDGYRVGLAKSMDRRGGQERARQRPDHRVRSDLVHTKIPVPAKRHDHEVEIGRERTEDSGRDKSAPGPLNGDIQGWVSPGRPGAVKDADQGSGERGVRDRVHLSPARRSRRAARPNTGRSGTRTRDVHEPGRQGRQPPAAPRP